MAEDQSTSTVLVAGTANLVIAVAKLVAGLASGSSAMLSEAAHSFGDTMNQVFLMAALRKSRKPPDPKHPFGYGMERYFWSLLAAVGIFVLGAGFSAYQGIESLLSPGGGSEGSPTWAFVVLGISFLFEGTSFGKGVLQLRGNAADAGAPVVAFLRGEADPALRAVIWEDGAALIGLVLAAGGLGLDTVRGGRTFDGIASLAIGALLIGVAYGLGRQNQQYLIGKAASPELQSDIADAIDEAEGVDSVLELMTMRLSPEQVLVAARVDLADHLTPEQIERAADEIDDLVRERFPEVRHLFLDPTPDRDEAGAEAPN
ncbi:MAG TPA: cation diffusion facilitator family transporter [Nocardioides sp.]|jgi:cation diffusion facilitator family transporter|nr:cation diffusion facilitator family transporter [Nocardioides sp.]